MRISERIYRMLLKAYPERYRRHYESPMAQLFSDQLRAADTPWKRTALWLRTLGDLARTLPARHVEAPRHSLYGLENAQSVPYVPWSLSARKSVFFARAQASSFGRKTITTEDLLLGILREDPQLAEMLGGAAAVEQMRREIEARESHPRRVPPAEDLPLNHASRSALALAKGEAPQSGPPEATPRHLLAGILQQQDTLAAQLLRQRGISLERLRPRE